MRGGLAARTGFGRANAGQCRKITSGPAQRNRCRSVSVARHASTSGPLVEPDQIVYCGSVEAAKPFTLPQAGEGEGTADGGGFDT
jgi:hypothetical protein